MIDREDVIPTPDADGPEDPAADTENTGVDETEEPAEAEETVDAEEAEEVARTVSGYDDVALLFEELAATVPGSARRAALRSQLINRCIPLADHIARKFSGRGEPFDDLTQVARVGLVHAVDRFDITRGSNFLSFAVPTI
ncbi:sigma factor, partial [Nocardia tengchongensis]